jgi:phosphomevalonate kinase
LSLRIRVPGKLILLGEYAVLEGADALVASVDRYVIVDISENRDNICQIFSDLTKVPLIFSLRKNGTCHLDENQSVQTISAMRFIFAMIDGICRHIYKLGFPIYPFALKVDSSQFYYEDKQVKLGLGSSAALTVALTVAITKYLGIDNKLFLNKYDLFRFAHDVHFSAQGKRGSGIDIAASVYGGINKFNIKSSDQVKFAELISSVPLLKNLHLLTIWSGIPVSTQRLLSEVEKYRKQHRLEYKKLMMRLTTLSNSGCALYGQKMTTDFLDIVSDYYEVLKTLSIKSKIRIISDIHQKIAKIVNGSGGVYKPSGAGGGDIGIAFCASEKILENVNKDLTRHNFETISLGISTSGVVAE